MSQQLRYFSMFSGVGGFELGIQRAALSVWDRQTENTESSTSEQSMESTTKGLQPNRDKPNTEFRRNTGEVSCIGYSEIDKYAIKVYERHFNGHRNYGDATKINPNGLPDFDLLVGGFPCQAFSIAGKRKGFDDTRGTLFFDIARILENKRPRHLVLENVKGLLSHDSGKTFQTILGVLSDLGYGVEWQILNSKDFGVPQNRERIFFIGHLRGECGRKVFPITGGTGKNLEQLIGGSQGNRVYDTSGISSTIASQAGGLGAKTGLYAMRGRENGQQLEPSGDYTNTITSVTKDNLWIEKSRIRRLTPKECERLQGFPDDWTAGESDTQRYKMCGNAVTVNVIEAIMKEMCI